MDLLDTNLLLFVGASLALIVVLVVVIASGYLAGSRAQERGFSPYIKAVT